MNQFLDPVLDKCATFTLDEIVSLKKHLKKNSFAIVLRTKPLGLFEGWIEYKQSVDKKLFVYLHMMCFKCQIIDIF